MRLLLPALSILLAVPAAAQITTLLPVDQAAIDPTFITFRGRLLTALVARDTADVLSAFDPAARLSFGDAPGGPDGVRQMWLGEEHPPGEDLWTVLARVVATGSVRSEAGDVVTAPYVFDGFPQNLDPFGHAAVVGENVRVRVAPRLDSEILDVLTYAVLPVTEWGVEGAARRWHKVRLADGREGYVAAEYLWSPINYRVGFQKTDGRWRITFFVAGD